MLRKKFNFNFWQQILGIYLSKIRINPKSIETFKPDLIKYNNCFLKPRGLQLAEVLSKLAGCKLLL